MKRLGELKISMLAVVISLESACAAPRIEENAAAQLTRSGKEHGSSSTLPDALIGVWYRNDDDGRRSCDSYRKVGSTIDTDEESCSLIGSLVVTKGLVHANAEYGEGDFHAVKRVADLGNQEWRVDALVGTDFTPTEGVNSGKDAFRFVIESGLLSMENEMDELGGNANSSRFFRCGEVIDGLYENRADTTW